jgi:hypothetical protein
MPVVLVVAVRILEGMFVMGTIGCLAVLALTAIEDVRTLLDLDKDDYTRQGVSEGSRIAELDVF